MFMIARALFMSTAVFLIGFPAFCAEPKDKTPDRIEFILSDTFESGELNAWESYPIAEDPGFDPEICCVKEPAFKGSAYSLAKVIKPTDTDYPRDENLVGMTKKTLLWTSPQTELSVAAFLDGDRKAKELRIILYSSDGKRFAWSHDSPAANTWIPLRLPMSSFSAGNEKLAAGKLIEAVTVMASYGPVSPHRSYTICIDDFTLTGESQRRFIAKEPASTYFDKFFFNFLNRHFYRGETLSLKVQPEDGNRPLALSSVNATVYDSHLNVKAKNVLLESAGGGIWSAASLYRIGENDPAGRWKIELNGTGSGGELVHDELFFLAPEKRFTPKEHPRLFFSADELLALKTDKDPKRAKILQAALASARNSVARGNIGDIVEAKNPNLEFLDGGPFSTNWEFYRLWSRPGGIVRDVASSGGFLYALTGDAESGKKAKEFMLRFADFNEWMHPWFLSHHMYGYYPVGQWCYGMAIGYDLLYPLFTPDERAKIRKAMMEKAIIPHYRDHVLLNRKPSNITNHIGMNTTGIILGTLALLGEDPENPDMEPYLSGFLAKYKAHIDAAYCPDGSYAEPEGYAGTDTEDLVKCLDALERSLGIDWTTTTNVKDVYLYPLYMGTANGHNCPAFGDGGRDWGFALRNLHLWLAHRTKDRIAIERYRWQTESGAFSPAYTVFDYLWYPDQNYGPMNVNSSIGNPSHWFWSKGNVVFRSGMDQESLIFAMKCGPHSNHYHLDQGTFWLLYNNETLLSEAGYATYYQNLYYRSFYIQPVAHNTLLLNEYPESQRIADLDDEVHARNEFPRITSCFIGGPAINDVESELSCVYKGRLSKYTRSFVYMGQYLVMYDEAASFNPERFTWVFNTEGKDSFKGSGSTVQIVRPKAELRMEILAPEKLSRTVKPHPDRDGSLIMFTTSESFKAEKFLAVLIPSREDNRKERDSWKISRINLEGWTGAVVKRDSSLEQVLFRTDSGNNIISAGDCETDGDRMTVRSTTEKGVRNLWVRGATTLKKAGKTGETLMNSSDRLSVEISYIDKTILMIGIDSKSAATFSLKVDRKPKRVLLNGKEETKFTYDNKTGMATFTLKAGENGMDIRI
jgi:hypothetical protein